MAEFKFIFKSLLATLVLVALMQIKLGDRTIETRAYQVLAHSEFAEFINHVAKGSIQLAQQASAYVAKILNEKNK